MTAERETVRRFDDRVRDYVRFRPGYPPEAIEAVLAGLGDPAGLRAADVGAGTGISARLLAERGVRVEAVEPNASMAAAAEPHDRIVWRRGAADSTGLPDAGVDLVLCAQAYHWFDPVGACREFDRILKPGGRLALMWNDADESTPLAHDYYNLLRAVSTDTTLSHKTVAWGPDLRAPFDKSEVLEFQHTQRLDADGLLGRAMSASYVPKSGSDADRVRREIPEIHSRHANADGVAGLLYRCVVYLTSCSVSG